MNPPATSMLSQLKEWQALGWISALDWALVNFLAQQVPTCPEGLLLGAAMLSRQLAHGHVCLDLAALLRKPDLGWPSQAEHEHLRPSQLLAGRNLDRWCEEMAQAADVLFCPSANYPAEYASAQAPLVLVRRPNGARLYLARHWRAEQRIAQHILSRLAQPLAVPQDLAARLQRLFPHSPPDGSDWQKLACALAARASMTLITGGPGTGKTTTVIRLLALLQEDALSQGRALRIRLAAPTGKAAARLTASIAGQIAALDVDEAVRAAIPAEVSTLHRLLGSRPDSRQFHHHRYQPLSLDLLVVDEASMIDLEMMDKLLEALPPQARLILLGDKDQLASVEAGAVLGDLCLNAEQGHYSPDSCAWLKQHCGTPPQAPELRQGQSGQHRLAQQTVMLRHSHRFQADSGIGQFAQAINRGDSASCLKLLAQAQSSDALTALNLESSAGQNWPQFIVQGRPTVAGHGVGYGHYLGYLREQRPEPQASEAHWQQWAWGVLQAFGQFQLLSPVRDGDWGVSGLNSRIALSLHQVGLLEEHERWPGHWYEGRPVLVTRNDYNLGIMNGDVGICLRLPEAQHGRLELRVAFPHPERAGQVRFLHPSRLNSVDCAFAMTVHKSQGSEFSHAALVLPAQSNPVLTRELLYTAVTRAKQSFTLLLHNEQVLKDCIRRRVERETGLQDLLWPQP